MAAETEYNPTAEEPTCKYKKLEKVKTLLYSYKPFVRNDLNYTTQFTILQEIENFIIRVCSAYLESDGVDGREEMGLDLRGGLLTVDFRKEKAGLEKDLQREAIVEN